MANAGVEFIIEDEISGSGDLYFHGVVFHVAPWFSFEDAEFEVVGGNNARSTLTDELADEGTATGMSVTRVGALQYFVKKKENLLVGATNGFNDGFEAL